MIVSPRTGPGPGPRRRPERPEVGVWLAAGVIAVGLVLSTAGSTFADELPVSQALVEPSAAPGAPGFIGPVLTTTVGPDGVTASAAATSAAAASATRVEPVAFSSAIPDERARIAVRVAMEQIGLPYVWGGNGPENGHRGFDCSGLTTFAYGKAGVELPRTAHTQFRHGPRVPAGAPLQPGDLVFYGTYAKVHHVGMYIGGGRMVNAPTFGKPVQTAWYRYAGDDYIGATRPAGTGVGTPVPDPAVPAVPDPTVPDRTEFPAPAAPPPPAPDPAAAPVPESETAARSRDGATAQDPTVTTTAASTAPSGTAVPTARPEGGRDDPSGTSTPPGTTPPGTTTPGTTTAGTEAPRTTTPGSSAPTAPPGTNPPQTGTPGATTPGSGGPTTTTPGPTTPKPTTPRPTTPKPTTPRPTTPKPTTPGPTTPKPTTPAPSTPKPTTPKPTTPKPTPTPTSPSAEGSADARVDGITLGGATRELAAVARRDADGIPTTAGVWTGTGRWIVRLATMPDVVGGSAVRLHLSDGAVRTLTAGTSRTVDAPTAGGATGTLVVLAPAGDGTWTLFTAS